MLVYISCAVIWIFILIFSIPLIRKHILSGIYAHCGVGLFFTSLALGLYQVGTLSNILPLEIIGFVLYIPAAFLVVSSHVGLRRRGKAKTTVDTTTLTDSGVYGIVRHPMHLGMVIWSVGLMLTFQSVPCIILGIIAIGCFWMASKKEDAFNIQKFGVDIGNIWKRFPCAMLLRD
jgi:protein-S-isoprenylcysteine O-methyltransferase Ste14